MADERKMFVFKFSQTFVNVVNYFINPEYEKEPDKSELFRKLEEYLDVFLDRYKMELYFVFAEELARFGKKLNDETFKELLQSMVTDLKEDEFDLQVFAWYCVVLAYYGAIAKRKNVQYALRSAVRAIMDTILHYEKEGNIEGDIVENIVSSIKKTAELIQDQNIR